MLEVDTNFLLLFSISKNNLHFPFDSQFSNTIMYKNSTVKERKFFANFDKKWSRGKLVYKL